MLGDQLVPKKPIIISRPDTCGGQKEDKVDKLVDKLSRISLFFKKKTDVQQAR